MEYLVPPDTMFPERPPESEIGDSSHNSHGLDTLRGVVTSSLVLAGICLFDERSLRTLSASSSAY